MLRELIRESLRCCTRDQLERIQPDSSVLDELIVAGSGMLPLRTIYAVEMGSFVEERLQVRVADSEDLFERAPDFDVSLFDGDFDIILLRLQHAFVMDFHLSVSDSGFLQHFRANTQNVEFVVNRIWFDLSTLETPDDYTLLDSIVNLLRPQAYSPALDLYTKERWVDLLKRETFLSNMKTLAFDDNHGDLPEAAFVLIETRYPNYELESEESDIVAWIDNFFDAFIRGECTNDKLQSVSVTWEDDHDEEQKSRMPKLLSEPSIKDVRIPRDDFAAYRTATTRPDYRVGQCDLYLLTSTKLRNRMDVFKWTAEVPEWRSTIHAMLCEVKDI